MYTFINIPLFVATLSNFCYDERQFFIPTPKSPQIFCYSTHLFRNNNYKSIIPYIPLLNHFNEKINSYFVLAFETSNENMHMAG